MKILRILSSGFEQGGAENGVVLMDSILKEKGFEIKIMASDRRMDLPRFDDYTFKNIPSNKFLSFFYCIFNPSAFFLLKKILFEYKPDLVQIHTMTGISPSILFLLNKTPTVLTIHGPEEFTPSLLLWQLPSTDFKNYSHRKEDLTITGWLHYIYFTYITGFVFRRAKKNIDRFVVFSGFMQNLLKNDKIASTHIANGTKLFENKPLPNENIIAYVGRLEAFKGVNYLINAISNVVKEIPNIKLIIAGEGNFKKQLEDLVSKLNISDNVTFLGHLSRSDIEKVYIKSKILVIPSVWPEAFGKVGIEAMSVGRPVIASNVGGISEWLVDGTTGYLVPPKDPKSISEKVVKILSDKKLLDSMSFNARKQSEKFDIAIHAEKIIKLYNEVIMNSKKNK